jgi:S1-C subfamily serine protease
VAGISIGHSQVTAGTLGGLVRDSGRQDNGRRYILSNHHVLADHQGGQAGDAILQPGSFDGGRLADDRLARLTRAVPLRFGGAENRVDAAIAEIEPADVLADVCGLGLPRGTRRPVRDLVVLKHGRTTGLTKGIITDVDADIQVDYDGRTAFFVNSVVIRGLPETQPFSESGDSGALIFDSQQRACGLLFAGSQATDLTFANPIGAVLRRLRIRLV